MSEGIETPQAPVAELIARLTDAVGENHVLTDPEVTASFETDWTGRFGGASLAVVRPGDSDQVAEVLAACRAANVGVIPQGGNTGLVGGGVPRGGEQEAYRNVILLSTVRLKGIGEIDVHSGQVDVGPGVTLAELQEAARAAGFNAALDFGARDSATIGGIVACDAGGIRALRYGTARRMVAGLEAVLADGSRIDRMGGLPKDNSGYDLPSMMLGSEGTLGVVTKVRWQLHPRYDGRVVALVCMPGIEESLELLGFLRSQLTSLESCDFFIESGMNLVLSHTGRRSPFPDPSPVYLVIECADGTAPTDDLISALDEVGIDRAVIADDTPGRHGLWEFRERHTEAISDRGIVQKFDVAVPLSALAAFLDRVEGRVAAIEPEAETYLFGHLGDGNVHVNVLGAARSEEEVEDAVLGLVLECGGTISAEHGIGTAKAAWVERALGQDNVHVMRAIKDSLDPDSIMNPGAVLPLDLPD